jgi:hypothetical protein
MDEQVKKLWIEALRSGEYRQTKGVLRRLNNVGYSHCCLGVLCDLHAKKFKGQWTDGNTYETKGHESSAFLPGPVWWWAGLNGDSPLADGITLARMNDSGQSFEEIAEVIERHL